MYDFAGRPSSTTSPSTPLLPEPVRIVRLRGAPVLDHIALYSKPITCDGYVVYKSFKTWQRCMDHIMLEATFLEEARKIQEPAALHKSLQELRREAGQLRRQSDDAPMADAGPVVAGAPAITSGYDGYGAGRDYAAYHGNAAPNMFTFVNHTGMESPPTTIRSARSGRLSYRARSG